MNKTYIGATAVSRQLAPKGKPGLQMSKETVAALTIMLGAAGWGCTGIFVNLLGQLGLGPLQIVCIRVTVATILFSLYLLVTNRQAFKIMLRDIPLFIGTGVFSLSLFNWCYFNAITFSSMSVASVLLYTSPIFVLLMAVIFFKEKLSARKTGAVLCTFLGCFLVSGVMESSDALIAPKAIGFGICAGFTYALYSIIGRFALAKYRPSTVIMYTFLFSSLALLPIAGIENTLPALASGKTWLLCIAFGLISTVLPYLLYTQGLQHFEASKAAVLATMEPIVACVIGISLFHDVITPLKALGISLILVSVLALTVRTRKA